MTKDNVVLFIGQHTTPQSPTIACFYLDVSELGEHHVSRGGMEGWKLPIKVGKTYQRSKEDLRLHSRSLHGGGKRQNVKRNTHEMKIKKENTNVLYVCVSGLNS